MPQERAASPRRARHTGAGAGPSPRWLREYGWLVAAGGLALTVLLCSRALLPSPAPAWRADGSTATSAAPAVLSATDGVAEPTTTPTAPSSSASASSSAGPLRSTARPSRSPSPRPTAPRPAVLLGPESGRQLWEMLNRYCRDVTDSRQARLRSGSSPAVGNWECQRHGPDILIDMTAACRHAYGAVAFARYTDADDAFSWRCYRRS